MEQSVLGERITGAILMAAGLFFAWYSAENYNLGTLRRIGPGMFPMGLGVALAGLGLAIAIVAPDRRQRRPEFDLRVAAAVVAAILTFGLLVGWIGLVPAIIGTVAVGSLAESPFRPVSVILLGAGLCVLSWLIFRVGLGLPMPLLRWPF